MLVFTAAVAGGLPFWISLSGCPAFLPASTELRTAWIVNHAKEVIVCRFANWRFF